MLGFYLNLLLIVIGILELATGIFVRIQEKDSSDFREFIPTFTFFSTMICCGYGLMGIMPDVSKAYIPRFFGLWGCLGLLLTEFSVIIYDKNISKIAKFVIVNIPSLFGFVDLFLYGQKGVNNYIRHDFYNTFELADKRFAIFNYGYLMFLGILLLVMSVRWYKTKTIKREKRFVAQIILSNFIMLFCVIPVYFPERFFLKYPTIPYCFAFAVNFFIWIRALKKKLSFTMTIKNVSEGIFYTIDIPIIIFSVAGKISLYNQNAQNFLELKELDNVSIRDVFNISDVEELRIKTKANRGEDYQIKTSVKSTGTHCLLRCSVKMDYAGEPYCIIGTILAQD